MTKSTITIHRNAEANSLTVVSADDVTNTFDFPGLSRLKQQGINETVVNMFCASRGFPLMYGKGA